MGQHHARRVPEKVYAMEIAATEPFVKAIALGVIAHNDAGIRHDAKGDINQFTPPKTVDNDYIEAELRSETQDSIDCFNISRRIVDRNKMQLNIRRRSRLQL